MRQEVESSGVIKSSSAQKTQTRMDFKAPGAFFFPGLCSCLLAITAVTPFISLPPTPAA